MKRTYCNLIIIIFSALWISSCDNESSAPEISYDEWTVIDNGLSEPVTKNVLTEFVGSTNCPYCPESDALLLSYFDSSHDNFVGTSITDKWFLINYHTYSPARGDPMYEFLRGANAEEDFCYVRFEEGSWYTLYGVPTTYTNGIEGAIYPEMASTFMANSTPIQLSLDGTTFNGPELDVQVTITSSKDLNSNDSLRLFIAAIMDNVEYTGYNGEPLHQDVFLGWINEGFNGELILVGNEQVSKKYSWVFPSNWPQNDFETTWPQVEYDISGLGVVAFIQNIHSKEILQVAGKK